MKFISVILSVILVLLTFVSCATKNGGTNPTEAPTEKPSESSQNTTDISESNQVAGGWTINTEFGAAEIPAQAKEAFNKANAKGYTPVAYLGSQVVAGLNFAYLCKTDKGLAVVKLYRDLQGNCQITDEKAISIPELITNDGVKFNPTDFAGGWNYSEADGADLPANVEAAFEKATAGEKEVDYDELALLGSQVVAGQNFAILCKAESENENETAALAVAIVYADLSGNAQLTSVSGFTF